ncbi:unnamed protein product, partial [Scytosiphon promiscuus]
PCGAPVPRACIAASVLHTCPITCAAVSVVETKKRQRPPQRHVKNDSEEASLSRKKLHGVSNLQRLLVRWLRPPRAKALIIQLERRRSIVSPLFFESGVAA